MQREQQTLFKKLGAEVRKARLAKGMTLEDMQGYGFSAQHFQKIETGKKAVNFYTVYRMAQALKVRLSSLVRSVE